MRILLLAPQPFYQGRGTPIAVRMLAEELHNAGHHVDLLVYHEGEDIDLQGVQIHRVCALPGVHNIGPGLSWKKIVSDFFMFWKALGLARRNRYDVYHAVEESIFLALLLKLIFKKPCIYDVDSWMSEQILDKYNFLRWLAPVFSLWERIAVRCSDGAIAVCKALEDKIRALDATLPILRLEDVCMVEQGSIQVTESLQEIVGKEQDKILLYVGNLESYQGIDLLLDAYALLCSERDDTDLILIGGQTEAISIYRKKAEELKISDHVFLIGPRPLESLGTYLQQADILLSPRLVGTNTPMKIYSYMGSGRAIVATKICSHTQVLDQTISYLAEPTPEDLKKACLEALSDEEQRKAKAQKALDKVETHYSRTAFRKKLLTFYTELQQKWNL